MEAAHVPQASRALDPRSAPKCLVRRRRLQNSYLLAKVGADQPENASNLPNIDKMFANVNVRRTPSGSSASTVCTISTTRFVHRYRDVP